MLKIKVGKEQMKKGTDRTRVYWIFFSLIFIAAGAGALSQLFIASQMHLSGDDYCYNAVLARDGFWKMQWTSYTEVSMYNGNRYALNLFAGLAGLIPVWGTPILIISSLLLWLVGASGLTLEIVRRIGWQVKKVEAILFSLILLNFILVSAPNLQQSLYWRSGMLPYFVPLVGIVLMGWLILVLHRRSIRLWRRYGLVFLLALLFSGFSESATALLIGLWGIGLLISIFFFRENRSKRRDWLGITGVGLAGSLIGLALLYFSPSTALRMANMPDPIGITALIALLLRNLKIFFWQALMRRTLYLVLPLAFGFGLGLLLPAMSKPAQNKRPWVQFLGIGAAIASVTVLLIALVFLPATYIFADYPPLRALILAQFVMVVAETLGGVWLSMPLRWLSAKLIKGEAARKVILGGLSIIMIAAFVIAPIRLIRSTLAESPKLLRWSRFWVDRHEQLIRAGMANEAEVHVIQLDHVINEVGELSPDAQYWYNNCAEMYYGINAIYADQPGW